MSRLTLKQEGFAMRYVLHRDASKAYRENYNCKNSSSITVNVNAAKLLKNTKVALRVRELKAELARIAKEEFEVDARYVLYRLVSIDQMDVADILNDHGNVKPIKNWPKTWRTYVVSLDIAEIHEGQGNEHNQAGVIKKIKWPDKLKNLEMLGKHIDVQAFKNGSVLEQNICLAEFLDCIPES